MRRSDSILVTGGAGFIGSELVRELAAEGHNVLVLDNLATGRWGNLDGIRAECIEGDVRDRALAGLLKNVSTVYHLACLGVRHSLHAPVETHEVNAGGTLVLLEAARRAGVERFVHVSSSEVYGPAQSAPMTEQHPVLPTTVYGASKLAGEAYARAYHRTYGFPAVIVRPFNSFGPRCHHEGDSGEVIPKFLLRAKAGRPLVVFGDGEQSRDFTYVRDTAHGIRLAGIPSGAIGRTFNLGSGREISINNLARMIAPAARVVHEAPRPGDVRRLVADATLAHDVLGFRPRVTLQQGLSLLSDWHEQQRIPAERLLEAEIVRSWERAS